jgi:hypothetical protein
VIEYCVPGIVALEHDEARSLSGGQANTAISLSSALKTEARSYAGGIASTGRSYWSVPLSLGPDDLHRLLRQPLPFLQFAGEKFDAGDAFDFFHNKISTR